MRLHPVNKLNIKDVLRTPSYVAMLLIMIILPFNSLLQILRTNNKPNGLYSGIYLPCPEPLDLSLS